MLRSITMTSLAGLITLTCWAQTNPTVQTTETESKKFYRLNFAVQELESERTINSRSYSIIMRGDKEKGSIRAGEKVPLTSGGMSSQIDVGVSVDCQRLEETANGVSLHVKADISSVIDGTTPGSLPIIRQNQWESSVALPLKQPTILFSSDDPASKHRMQLQLTVTPIR